MAYYFTDGEDRLLKLDISKATRLLRERERQGRWRELYRTPRGRFVLVNCTLWQGERDTASEISESEAVRLLALAEPNWRTEEGDAVLSQLEPNHVEEA